LPLAVPWTAGKAWRVGGRQSVNLPGPRLDDLSRGRRQIPDEECPDFRGVRGLFVYERGFYEVPICGPCTVTQS